MGREEHTAVKVGELEDRKEAFLSRPATFSNAKLELWNTSKKLPGEESKTTGETPDSYK